MEGNRGFSVSPVPVGATHHFQYVRKGAAHTGLHFPDTSSLRFCPYPSVSDGRRLPYPIVVQYFNGP